MGKCGRDEWDGCGSVLGMDGGWMVGTRWRGWGAGCGLVEDEGDVPVMRMSGGRRRQEPSCRIVYPPTGRPLAG